MTQQAIDFGVLDPATTEVFGKDTHHVLLRGQKGGEQNWPYAPEVLQRRDNTFRAALGIVIRPVHCNVWERALAVTQTTGVTDLFELCHLMKDSVDCNSLSKYEVVLLQMRRPAAPQGVEWNCPGGVVDIGESSDVTVVREGGEETQLTALAKSSLFSNLQFSSGVYREMYDIYAMLCVGWPQISAAEGIVSYDAILLRQFSKFVKEEHRVDITTWGYCGVDGKVIMGVNEIIRRFAEIGIR